MFSKHSTAIVAHLIGWLLFIILMIGFLVSGPGDNTVRSILFSWQLPAFFAIYVSVFYLNSYWFMPKLYFKRKYMLYVIVLVASLVIVILLKPFDHLVAMNHSGEQFLHDRPGPPPDGPRFGRPGFRPGRRVDMVSIVLFVMTWTFSTVLQLMRRWEDTEKRVKAIEAEKVQAELLFLKAQINPHFLFNTLNNIYSLAVSNSTQTPEAIIRLSGILRYLTEDASNQMVPLEHEVACMTNYIELQKLRLNDKTTINYSISGEVEGKMIPPLILMTFVENVFKYGVSAHEAVLIQIKLEINDHSLYFFTQNPVLPSSMSSTSTGIGILNTQKRLDHLYADRHELAITNDGDIYTVKLRIGLK